MTARDRRELGAFAAWWLATLVTALVLLAVFTTARQPPECMHDSQGDWQDHWTNECEER